MLKTAILNCGIAHGHGCFVTLAHDKSTNLELRYRPFWPTYISKHTQHLKCRTSLRSNLLLAVRWMRQPRLADTQPSFEMQLSSKESCQRGIAAERKRASSQISDKCVESCACVRPHGNGIFVRKHHSSLNKRNSVLVSTHTQP